MNNIIKLIILDAFVFLIIFMLFKYIKKKIIYHIKILCPYYVHNSKLHSFVSMCISTSSFFV